METIRTRLVRGEKVVKLVLTPKDFNCLEDTACKNFAEPPHAFIYLGASGELLEISNDSDLAKALIAPHIANSRTLVVLIEDLRSFKHYMSPPSFMPVYRPPPARARSKDYGARILSSPPSPTVFGNSIEELPLRWVVRNTGTKSWECNVEIASVEGRLVGNPQKVPDLQPGKEAELIIMFFRRQESAQESGYWQLRWTGGIYFGDEFRYNIEFEPALQVAEQLRGLGYSEEDIRRAIKCCGDHLNNCLDYLG